MKTADKTARRRYPSERSRASRTRSRRGGAIAADRLIETQGRLAEPSQAARAVVRGERERRLEEVMLTTWAALNAGHPVECPVCGGALTAADGCRACGSQLS
jgi:hypothetical protein